MVDEKKIGQQLVDERLVEELPKWVSILNKLWKLAAG